MNPVADFRTALFEALMSDDGITEGEARDLAARVSAEYLSSEDVGEPHFEIQNFSLRLDALCQHVAEQGRFLPGGGFEGRILLGALHWILEMRDHHRAAPNRLAVDAGKPEYGLIEAAVCMALSGSGVGTPSESVDARTEALLERVNGILGRGGLRTIEAARLRQSLDRLHELHCSTPRAGWYGLRTEMEYQVVDD